MIRNAYRVFIAIIAIIRIITNVAAIAARLPPLTQEFTMPITQNRLAMRNMRNMHAMRTMQAMRATPITIIAARLLLIGVILCTSGCQLPALVGALAQNEEYQRKKEVLARYAGLEGKVVAVLVNADLAVQYDYPQAVPGIAYGIAGALATHANCRVIHPDLVAAWQFRTPNWHGMPYGDMADSLNADRVVYVDLLEYRLTPPGNRFNWEGLTQATISVLERDGFDPDTFVDSFTVTAEFPKVPELTQYEATAEQITRGLQQTFVQQVTWLFFDHIEPKYPDKYRPELDPDVNK